MDDDELEVGEDDEGEEMQTVPDGKVVPEKSRAVPPTIETRTFDEAGNEVVTPNVARWLWVEAAHNMPGFLQSADPGEDPVGLVIGQQGWIPNNEEGVTAVQLGFAKLVDIPRNPPLYPDGTNPSDA